MHASRERVWEQSFYLYLLILFYYLFFRNNIGSIVLFLNVISNKMGNAGTQTTPLLLAIHLKRSLQASGK